VEVKKNFAFIDSQNLYQGIRRMGWALDFQKFRIYIREKYKVHTAYLFFGYLPEYAGLYRKLRASGYELIFKEVVRNKNQIKGNCDSDLVFEVMRQKDLYEQALIVTGDGDFARMVAYLYIHKKLAGVLAPHHKTSSVVLKKAAREKFESMEHLQGILQKRSRDASPHPSSKAGPHRDETP
jgi:uncharacterized LabA/DUF88 family protein